MSTKLEELIESLLEKLDEHHNALIEKLDEVIVAVESIDLSNSKLDDVDRSLSDIKEALNPREPYSFAKKLLDAVGDLAR
jgi:hypothetical protein